MGKSARSAAERYSMESVTNTHELDHRRLSCTNLVPAKVAGANWCPRGTNRCPRGAN